MKFKEKFLNGVEWEVLLIAISCTTLYFLALIRQGFNLADESYLWYGSQRVLAGEIPILDFMSYDPGRYYWSAGFMSILNSNGIYAQRVAIAAFQFLGIYAGLLLISSELTGSKKDRLAYLILITIIFLGWMFPSHKLFDISVSILLVILIKFLITKPNQKRFLLTGIFLGMIFFFGKNHGLYGLISLVLAICWLTLTRENKKILKVGSVYLILGLMLGLAPLIMMMAIIPEFYIAYFNNIKSIFDAGKTNFDLPIPWPWTIDYQTISLSQIIDKFLIGSIFILLIILDFIFVVYICCKSICKKILPLSFVASVFVSIPYIHFAYSRADLSHLAQSIFPLLIGIFIILGSSNQKVKWGIGFLVLGISARLTFPLLPCWNEECIPEKIYQDQLNINKKTEAYVTLIGKLREKYCIDGDPYVVIPFMPGAYAIFNAKSPVWGIYVQHPQTINAQLSEISKIESAHPKFILINTKGVDGKVELSYPKTHPLVYTYIKNQFTREKIPLPESSLELYVKKIKN